MILGADPQQLDNLASRISSRADSYEQAHREITYWLNRLTWQGPNAVRFRSRYRASMGPQLTQAAGALRGAASELRAQAASQQATSRAERVSRPAQTPLTSIVGPSLLGGGVFGGGTYMTPVPGLINTLSPDVLADIRHLVESGQHLAETGFDLTSLGLEMFEIGDFAHKAGMYQALDLFHPGRLPNTGIERILGSTAGKVLGGLGAGIAIATLPGDIGDLVEDIQEFDWNDQDSIEQFFYSGTDILMSAGAILGVTPLAPVGMVLLSTGLVMKVGTAVLPSVVNWGVDNVVWPAWGFISKDPVEHLESIANGIKSTYDFVTDTVPGFIGGALQGAGVVAGELADDVAGMAGIVGSGFRRTAEDFTDVLIGVDEAVSGVFDGVSGAVGGAIEGVQDFGEELVHGAVSGVTDVLEDWTGGWLKNPF